MFECDVCGRSFKTKRSLVSHIGYHKRKALPSPPLEPTKPDTTKVDDKAKVGIVKSTASANQHQQVRATEDSKAAEIRALLEKGYTLEQLTEDLGFAESTVRLEMSKFTPPENPPDGKGDDNPPQKPPGPPVTARFKGTVIEAEYTQIMQAAQEAAKNEWHWEDMNLTDFFDTILYLFFKERGIILQGYVVLDKEEGKTQ